MNSETRQSLSKTSRVLVTLGVTGLAAALSMGRGFDYPQIISASVFTLIIVAAVCFWDFNLPIAFVGVALLTMLGVMDLPRMIALSHLDVILFLVGMMVIVGILRELGLFSWLIVSVISIPNMSGRLFTFIFCSLGALMSCMVDEMSSIVLTMALIFQVCDTLGLKPTPFVIMAVMSVNIGSAGTMLGNPVGILIGQDATPPLTFPDFMRWSFPVMLVEFAVVFAFLTWNFRREIREMHFAMARRREGGATLGPIMELPYGRGLAILLVLMLLLSTHTFMEGWLGVPRNTMLIMTPLLLAGLLMLWRRERFRHYIEKDVRWVNLVVFMLLFVVAGTLEFTGVTGRLAKGFASVFGGDRSVLLPAVLGLSALGSAFVENIVFVAAFMPTVQALGETPLLWALMHGACLGGNITMIGSTANIAAVAMLEKRYWTRINFWMWLRTGVVVGVLSCLVAWAGFALQADRMPTPAERMKAAGLSVRK